MHDYTTIIGVIELRLHKISYDNVQKRYRIGRSGISLIMELQKYLCRLSEFPVKRCTSTG